MHTKVLFGLKEGGEMRGKEIRGDREKKERRGE